ncbi:hypothetical protein [Metaplanococcus flavidus]|uniref:GerMN domain-containing protein n=1 Tax=Metaplanococcus flavidus TaxID=569883 RepID=A0ABW3L996_9BACL
MPNNKWDEDHIENLLRDFPAIKDERPKEEVYKRLKNDHKPKKKPKRWIPMLVAALAFITFGVLLASTLGQNGNDSATDMSGSESSGESADSYSTAIENDGSDDSAATGDSEGTEEAAEAEEADAFTASQEADPFGAASVYDEDLGENTLFKLGMTENALVIPVSFIISEERLQEDFGTVEVDAVELYNRYAAEVDEESLGFDDYHPYSGTITASAQGIEHALPADHDYDMASASMTVYFNSLSASFNEAAEITIVNEAGEPVEFDQVGPLEAINPAVLNVAYYSYAAANGENHLTPGYNMPHENAVEALEAMKSSPSDLYTSLVPPELNYAVTETEGTVTVTFNEAIDFDAFDYEAIIRMIEGMALAADSFSKELVMDNTAAGSWDRFDFTESLPVPVGINVMEFNN